MTTHTPKTPEQVRKIFVDKSQIARQQQAYLNLLNSCSPADKEAIKALALIDDRSGGQIMRLVQIYQAIKQSK